MMTQLEPKHAFCLREVWESTEKITNTTTEPTSSIRMQIAILRITNLNDLQANQ